MPKTERVTPTVAELMSIATEAVDRAAHMIRASAPGRVTMKGDRDPATEVDFAVEREVRDFLARRAPDVSFLGEENGQSGSSGAGLMWALDPIDGTVNFIHGLPLCGVSLGLLGRSVPQLGVIDFPFLDLRYSAVLGGGAFRGDRQLSVANTRDLSDAVVAIGDYATGNEAELKNLDRIRLTQKLARTVQRIRMFGSAAIDLAWVAEGLIDASVMLANKPWDVAAGVVIAREAGAVVTDRHGREHGLNSESVVAASPAISEQLAMLIDEI